MAQLNEFTREKDLDCIYFLECFNILFVVE